MFRAIIASDNHGINETVFFHQFDMQINLLPLMPKSIEIQISIFTSLHSNQNFSHKVHIPFHFESPVSSNTDRIHQASTIWLCVSEASTGICIVRPIRSKGWWRMPFHIQWLVRVTLVWAAAFAACVETAPGSSRGIQPLPQEAGGGNATVRRRLRLIGQHWETGRIEDRCGRMPARPFERCCTAADVRLLAAVHVVIEASSLTITSRRRPMAPKAASIRSSRARCRTAGTRSTCDRCQPRCWASSALSMPCSLMPR